MRECWPIKRLDQLCKIARGGSPRPIKQFLTDDHDGINWIKISDATASSKYIYKTRQKIKPEGIRRSRMVYEGDFLLSNSMSFGRPYIMRTSGCIHDGWLVLADISEMVDQDYLYHFLGSAEAYQQFDCSSFRVNCQKLEYRFGMQCGDSTPTPPRAKAHRRHPR